MPKQPQIPFSGEAGKKAGPSVKDKPGSNRPVGLPPDTGSETKSNKPANLPQAVGGVEFEEDFTEVESGFPMAEPGLHHAKVIDFEKSESSSKNPQYVWQFRITAGNSKDIEIRHWTSLLPQARWKVAQTLDAVGIKAAGSIARFTKKDILGRPCIIEVIHDTYEGRLNHKVLRVHPPDESSIKFAKSDTTPF
jgi:hypothetical protein